MREAFTASATVRVIILLEIPPVPAGDLGGLKRAVTAAQEKVLELLGKTDFQVGHRFVTLPGLSGEISATGVEKLAMAPGVLRVDLDAPVHATLAQSVPLIRADQMQSLGHRGQGVVVAILDTGVATAHPDLSDALVGQECFCSVPQGSNPGCCPNGTVRQSGAGAAEDGEGHGTNVAGIVASNGIISSVGVAPDASLLPVKVLDNTGSGFISDSIAALNWIDNNRSDVKVINMSLGAGLFAGNCDSAIPLLTAAVDDLRNRGTLLFASAGNDASGAMMGAPACIANAVSVGAVYDDNIGGISYGPPGACTDSTTQADKVTCFSDSNTTTDLFAPGAAIRSDGLGNGVSTMYGTSQASPHAAGCAADLWSAIPSLTADQVETDLKASGVPVTDPKNNLTFPRVDCLGAFQAAGGCIDRDHDGYGNPASSACPHGLTVDCDDAHAAVYPGAPEICDGLNDNCSAPNWPAVPPNEIDQDGDGYPLCNDCNDLNAAVYPGAPQLCDGINNNCSAPGWPAVPANEIDGDGDGHLACDDCNDSNPAVYPGAPQICDGLNNNCSALGWPSLVGTNERDDDGDGLSECQGDCDDAHPAVYPGAPQVCDGLNDNCSAPGWPSLAGTNEADDDGDGLSECQVDCDDAHSAVYPGAPQICDGLNNNCSAPGWPSLAGTNEADGDGDGLSLCQGDCDDANPAVYPGAPQVCDGLNNSCLAPGWPSLAGTNEADDDGDGLSECQGDCDDADPDTHPNAVEVNDGKDNQCPGEPGFGIIDEVSGALAFANPADAHEISWPAQPGGSAYEVVRAASPVFPPACGDQITQALSWSDPAIPAAGQAFYYLLRSVGPRLGSWGQRSSGAERIGLCGAESACGDSLDNDFDGLTDCDDPDCFQAAECAPATFTFVDTTGDDIAAPALSDFFASVTAAPTDYIFFSLTGPGFPDFQWCSERADFYRDSYQAMALSGGVVTSGSWQKWSYLEGGAWTGPDTTGYLNAYSADCWEPYAWCAEFGLADRNAVISPGETAECETGDFTFGCSTGALTFTLKIGPRRLSTCGF